MNKTWIRRILFVVIAIVVVGGLAYALREVPALVDVAEVTEGPMKVTIREQGTTQIKDIYTISAPIAGQLTRIALHEGDPVEKGEAVASIRPLAPPLLDARTEAELVATRDAARSAVSIAEMQLQSARTSLDLAKQELSRAEKLQGPGLVSESVLEKAQGQVAMQTAQVASAQAAVEQRRAELKSAEVRLDQQPDMQGDSDNACCVELPAPIAGVVLTLYAESEQAVAAGTRIADVGAPDDLEVMVDLLSTDAVRIGTGSKAVITDWGGDRDLAATVRRIEPSGFTKVSALGVEEQRVHALLDLQDHDPRLGHGYRVFAELTVWESDKVVQVPISALYRVGNDWNLFVLTDGRLHQVPVEIGEMNDEVAEVLSGVEPGQVVVVHPSDTLKDGALAEPRNTTTGSL